MNKLFLLTVAIGSYMFAGINAEVDYSKNQDNTAKYSFVADSNDDAFKTDAGRRRGKGNRGRRRGGSGLK